jgi:dCTP deaminase
MSHSHKGALPSQTLHRLVDARYIKNVNTNNIRSSSIDLSLSDELYKVEGIFQPKQKESVRDVLDSIKKSKHSVDEPLVRGQMYIARINERMSLPSDVYGVCNPKSTSGRIDVHVRLIADGVSRYDMLMPGGWKGEMWVSIVPKSFSIKLYKGITLNQIRLFNQDTRFSALDLEIEFKKSRLLWRQYEGKAYSYKDIKVRDNDGSLILTLDLENDVLGYVAKETDEVLDLSKINHYNWRKFFSPVRKKGDYLYLKQNKFYILSTHESVRIPPDIACEMVGMDERSGEFRSHYAGFIDPGWGWGKDGRGKGRPLTLEVRPFEDIIVRQGQSIGKIQFERLTDVPDMHYDTLDSNYVIQKGPKLAKHFK